MDASDRKIRVAHEAADWFARLQSGQMDRGEREQFVEWLRESHLHVAEMLRIAQIHGSLERFQRWARISTGPKTDVDNVVELPPPLERDSHTPQDGYPAPRAAPSQARRERLGRRLLAIAAMLLVAVGGGVELARIRGQVIETERGERREVILADGSVLEVAPGTRLRVKYAEAERRVYLDRGRALFHVAKNPKQPFVVQSEATTVRAVGTAFGVERGVQGVIVTVSEGKVSVSSPVLRPSTPSAIQTAPAPTELRQQQRVPGSQARSPTAARNEQGEVLLTANEQMTVVGSGTAEPVRQVDSARALAWAQGRLIFQNDEVSRAVAEFNRYNRVQITVSDADLAGKPVSGVFNAAEPEAFIAFLQSVTPVAIERHGDRSITIASARRP